MMAWPAENDDTRRTQQDSSAPLSVSFPRERLPGDAAYQTARCDGG